MSPRSLRSRFRVPGGKPSKGVFAISAGTALAQGVTVAAGPLIARIYSPSELGLYTIVAASSAILGAIASFRWDFAIPLPDKEEDAHSLVVLGLLSIVVTSLISVGILWLAGDTIARLMGNHQVMPWLLLAPVIAAGQAGMKVLNQLAIRHRRYSAIGRRATYRSIIIVGLQIGLGVAGARVGGLCLGLAGGNAAGALSLAPRAGFRSAAARAGRTRAALRRNMVRYRRFALTLTSSSLLNVLGLQLPVLFIAGIYGSSVAGWLGLTQTLLALPVALLGQAVAQVYLGELSRSIRTGGNYRRLFALATRNLLIVAVLLAVALAALAPEAFAFVFGERWRTSGLYAQAFAPALALQMLAVPLSQTLIVMGRQSVQLLWDASRLVIVAGTVILFGVLDQSAYSTIWAYSLTSSAAYACLWLFSKLAIAGSTATA